MSPHSLSRLIVAQSTTQRSASQGAQTFLRQFCLVLFTLAIYPDALSLGRVFLVCSVSKLYEYPTSPPCMMPLPPRALQGIGTNPTCFTNTTSLSSSPPPHLRNITHTCPRHLVFSMLPLTFLTREKLPRTDPRSEPPHCIRHLASFRAITAGTSLEHAEIKVLRR